MNKPLLLFAVLGICLSMGCTDQENRLLLPREKPDPGISARLLEIDYDATFIPTGRSFTTSLTYNYNSDGRVTTYTNQYSPNVSATEDYEYDGEGRLTKRILGNSTAPAFGYDSLMYDEVGKLIQEDQYRSGESGITLNFTHYYCYNQNGLLSDIYIVRRPVDTLFFHYRNYWNEDCNIMRVESYHGRTLHLVTQYTYDTGTNYLLATATHPQFLPQNNVVGFQVEDPIGNYDGTIRMEKTITYDGDGLPHSTIGNNWSVFGRTSFSETFIWE